MVMSVGRQMESIGMERNAKECKGIRVGLQVRTAERPERGSVCVTTGPGSANCERSTVNRARAAGDPVPKKRGGGATDQPHPSYNVRGETAEWVCDGILVSEGLTDTYAEGGSSVGGGLTVCASGVFATRHAARTASGVRELRGVC